MANLVKREHLFNELSDLRHCFDRLFNRFLNHSASSEEPSARLIFAVPPIEAWVLARSSPRFQRPGLSVTIRFGSYFGVVDGWLYSGDDTSHGASRIVEEPSDFGRAHALSSRSAARTFPSKRTGHSERQSVGHTSHGRARVEF